MKLGMLMTLDAPLLLSRPAVEQRRPQNRARYRWITLHMEPPSRVTPIGVRLRNVVVSLLEATRKELLLLTSYIGPPLLNLWVDLMCVLTVVGRLKFTAFRLLEDS